MRGVGGASAGCDHLPKLLLTAYVIINTKAQHCGGGKSAQCKPFVLQQNPIESQLRGVDSLCLVWLYGRSERKR